MAMTKAQRNERQSQNRFTRKLRSFESARNRVIDYWRESAEKHPTHAEMLAYRETWIFPRNGIVETMGVNYFSQVCAVWDAMQIIAYRDHLAFCYAHPDTGVITPTKELSMAGLASRIDTSTGKHYWKNSDGTYTHPF